MSRPRERSDSDDEREAERRVLDVVRDLFTVLDAHGYQAREQRRGPGPSSRHGVAAGRPVRGAHRRRHRTPAAGPMMSTPHEGYRRTLRVRTAEGDAVTLIVTLQRGIGTIGCG